MNSSTSTNTSILLEKEATDILQECDNTLPPLNDSHDDSSMHPLDPNSSRRAQLCRLGSYLIVPLTDVKGTPSAILGGLCTLFLTGAFLGLSLPKNPSLPTPWYRTVSSVIGYIYFLSWSVSFYPQLITNWKRKSTRGLSADYCGLNVLGFACYAVYTISFYYSKEVQEQYRERHSKDSGDVTVQSNDVAFAVHALLASTITFCQIGYYGEGIRSQLPHKFIGVIMIGMLVCIWVFCVLVWTGQKKWIDFLYLLSCLKVMISLIKYTPQMILNYRRKSTVGWSIWNVILDFTGGVFSDVQLFGDCADFGDWSGITGNVAKLCLGSISVLYDIVFMFQHYVLYPNQDSNPQRVPLLQLPDEDEVRNRNHETYVDIDMLP